MKENNSQFLRLLIAIGTINAVNFDVRIQNQESFNVIVFLVTLLYSLRPQNAVH
jgi:hypothetical protein